MEFTPFAEQLTSLASHTQVTTWRQCTHRLTFHLTSLLNRFCFYFLNSQTKYITKTLKLKYVAHKTSFYCKITKKHFKSLRSCSVGSICVYNLFQEFWRALQQETTIFFAQVQARTFHLLFQWTMSLIVHITAIIKTYSLPQINWPVSFEGF